jgi:nitroreductase
MNSAVTTEVIKVMEERHSVRAYEKDFVIPKEELDAILRAASLAPSSWNLQHWKFLVIDSPEQKEKLLPIAYGQKQVVESSVTIAVLGDLEANRNGELVYGELASKGMITEEVKNTMLGQIEGAYTSPAAAQISRDEAIRNASLAAMQLMLAAKSLGYDTVPMGGYNAQQFIEAFNVPARYLPIMLITVGKAAKPAHASSRLPLEQIVVNNSF